MVFQAFGQALGSFADTSLWLWLLGGVVFGLFVGIVPGLGAITAMAIFLSVSTFLGPMEALPVMIALAAVGCTGGAITAIVLGIPGEPPNIVTTFDGFPMSKKGEGGRAVGAALTASVMGGVAPAFLAMAMIFLVIPLVMALTSMDMVFIILIGLSFVVMVGRGSMIKGLISGGLGFLVSTIGLAISTGEPRFTFGNAYFYDGLNLVTVSIALFAIPPMVELALKGGGGTIAEAGIPIKGMKDVLRGAKDVLHHWSLWARSSLLGYVFGIIPGVGSTGALFISYGWAKQGSKHPELFGTGMVEGVIAPESANNAKESGSLLTTLALGIPGSGTGAMLLAAFILAGLNPGPRMLVDRLPLCLTLILILAVANVIAAAICFALAPQMAAVARVPGRVLVPTVITVIFVGIYVSEGLIDNVVFLFFFSVVGVAIYHFGYNAGAFFLAFILGRLFEEYLFLGLQVGGPLFFLRPISLFLIFVLIAMYAYGPLWRLVKRRFKIGVEKA